MRCDYQSIGVKCLKGKKARFALFLLVLGTWLLMSPNASGQTPVGCNTGWAVFQRITGSFQLTGSGSETIDDGLGATTVNTMKQNINGTVDMTAFGLPLPGGGTCYSGFWIGTSTILVNLDEISTHTDPVEGTTTTEIAVSGGPNLLAPPTSNPLSGPALFANPPAGTFRLGTGSLLGVDTGVVNATQTSTDAGVVSTQQVQATWGPIIITAVPAQGNFLTVPLPATVGPITGSTTFQAAGGGLQAANWTLTWNFIPMQPNLDLIVSIPAYTTWRPTAGKTEKDTGIDPATGQPNTLEIDTQLVDKSTGQTAYADKLVFSLVEDSTEPGVALNWPPAGSATSDPDLTFDPVQNPFATISHDGMTATLVPVDGVALVDGNAFLSPHDWGGWAKLNVTATVGGQTITGHLQGDTTTDILIPKRQTGSHIADIWKTNHNVPLSTPDDDDSEVTPAGRPDCKGDGLTVYEEYRGFMENGKHIEGDPNSKDFFILNEIGADAEPGIFLFTLLTGLTVHKDIQKDEVETRTTGFTVDGAAQEGTPIINFNVGQGAFLVQQHGVLIRTCATVNGEAIDGGDTLWPGGFIHPQPAIIDFICMQGRDAPGTLLNASNTHNGVIDAVTAVLQYDLGVSHELLHSTGVLHHGDYPDGAGEGRRSFFLLGPGDPSNTTGQPLFQLNGQNVQILDELTELDVAPIAFQKTQAALQQCQAAGQNPSAYLPSVVTWCKFNSPNPSLSKFWVGLPQGKHSGSDQCIMRYPFAQLYPQASNGGFTTSNTTFYQVQSGTEPFGATLCTSPTGTGVNDPNRTVPKSHPQPRYWDARAGRGACQSWVCVSDNYPLQPDQASQGAPQ